MATLPLCWNRLHKFCLFLLHILTPSPNCSVFCFNQFYKQFIVTLVYLALLTFSEGSLSEEQKASSLFKSGSVVTWEWAFHNLWPNASANRTFMEIELLSQGHFPPSANSFLASKSFFIMPRTCNHCVYYFCLVWIGLWGEMWSD